MYSFFHLGFRPNQVLALMDTCMETDETCTIQLKTEVDNENRQKWERNVQDDVDEWFTLYNAQTKKYNTAENKGATTATCKKHFNLHNEKEKNDHTYAIKWRSLYSKITF